MKVRDLICIPLFILLSCNTAEPPPPGEAVMKLEALDASCTEAWLRISMREGIQPRTVTLRRDTLTILTQTLVGSDTTIVDEGLLPNRLYRYTLTRPTQPSDDRSTASIQTMDTTSHNFMWEIDTLGDGNSSVLYDVAIINDTLAYAVGEMYLRDSTGQFESPPYGLAIWNGQSWQLRRIYAQYLNNNVPISPRGIFVFSAVDVWLAWGDVFHWNGQSSQLQLYRLTVSTTNPNPVLRPNEYADKLWGTSSSNLYAVGRGGAIAHYNGTTWQRIEGGTTIPLNDVWGGSNRLAGENIVLITGGDRFVLGEKRILRLGLSGVVDNLVWRTVYRRPQSVWFDEHQVFVCGDGLFRLGQDGEWHELSMPLILLQSIRGRASNDLVAVGEFGFVLHYNGVSFREYQEAGLSTGDYKSVAVTANRVIAVGRSGSRAIVLVGRR